MNSYSKDIVQLLSDEVSVSLTQAVDLFYARMPTTPQNCTVVYDESGPPPLLQYVKSRSNYYYSSVSIRVRNTDYDAAWVIMDEIQTFLHGHSQVVINGTFYALIKAINPPHQLHFDENDRVVLIINFEVQRRPVSV